MLELTKKEFLRENGVQNGDTTKRSDVYTNLHRKVIKEQQVIREGVSLTNYVMEKCTLGKEKRML